MLSTGRGWGGEGRLPMTKDSALPLPWGGGSAGSENPWELGISPSHFTL